MNKTPKVHVFGATRNFYTDEIIEENPRKQRVAAYARVSTEQDEQQNSYAAQVDYYTNFIKRNPDWEFVGIFADEGITGTNTKKRDGFNKMIKQAMSGQIDIILTKSISRFARNAEDTIRITRELKEIGVEVRFEKENLQSLDPKSEMILGIFSTIAQEESRSISENVLWGKRKSMRDGKVSMPYSSFLGYKKGEDGTPEIVEEEAKIVKRIYQLFLDGYNYNGIANILTAEGIPTPRKKTKWQSTTVRSILTNEKYKGEALLQKTFTRSYLKKDVQKNVGQVPFYYVEDSHPAIIAPDVFDKVQELIKDKSRPKRKLSNPFAGNIICADCGSAFGHKTWNSRGKIKYAIWQCGHKRENGCKTPNLREEKIKSTFLEALEKKNPDFKDTEFSDSLWRGQIEFAKVYKDRIEFHFLDSATISVDI